MLFNDKTIPRITDYHRLAFLDRIGGFSVYYQPSVLCIDGLCICITCDASKHVINLVEMGLNKSHKFGVARNHLPI